MFFAFLSESIKCQSQQMKMHKLKKKKREKTDRILDIKSIILNPKNLIENVFCVVWNLSFLISNFSFLFPVKSSDGAWLLGASLSLYVKDKSAIETLVRSTYSKRSLPQCQRSSAIHFQNCDFFFVRFSISSQIEQSAHG